MKPQTMRIAFLVLFAVLILLFAIITRPFAKAAFLAFTLAVIFFPLHRFALERLKLPRYAAATATTLAVGLCVILPLAVLGTVVVTQIGHFLQGLAAQAEGQSVLDAIRPLIEAVHGWMDRVTGAAPPVEDLQRALIAAFKDAGLKFYELSPRVISTAVSIIANFVLMLLFLIVFFAEGSRLYSWLMETSPLSAAHRAELARDVRITITSSIVAAIVTAVAQGALLGVGFRVAGFSQPYGWGLVAIILSIIPVIGAASCYIAATLVLLSAGDTRGAILFLGFGLGVVSCIDNIIKPFIVRGSSRMHPLLLFVTLIGAMKLFGPIGLLVGPVLLSIFLAALRIYRREFVEAEVARR